MVVNRADLDSVWKFDVPKHTNRSMSRVPKETSNSTFTDGFFQELQDLQKLREPQGKSRRWTKILGFGK
jgi:hypothetical protein